MHLGTYLYTRFFGNLVGTDESKNKYFFYSKNFENLKAKRWVIYYDEIESSLIPPHWHAWLHKTVNAPPNNYKHAYTWQKDHLPNMTGTSKAYYPNSHPLSDTKKDIIEEYEAWKP